MAGEDIVKRIDFFRDGWYDRIFKDVETDVRHLTTAQADVLLEGHSVLLRITI
jgi:hypothetical protein